MEPAHTCEAQVIGELDRRLLEEKEAAEHAAALAKRRDEYEAARKAEASAKKADPKPADEKETKS